MNSTVRPRQMRRLAAALLVLIALALVGGVPASAQRPNGAGLIVRFGDGSIIYAYVQFEEETIASDELLFRSGLSVIISPYAGLGTGVCSINGEGCSSDNCYCQSYSTPAYFWHYYVYSGGWAEQLVGPSSRRVGDGDIEGWSWTAGGAGLPAVTIDEIALMNGVDRNPPPPPPTETPVPEPTQTPEPPPTNTPEPTATLPPTNTPQPPTPTAAEPTPTDAAVATSTVTTPTQLAAVVTATATRTASPTATVEPTATTTGPTPTLTLVASATTAAVLVQPDGTVVPVEVVQSDDGSSSTSLLMFGGLVAVALGAGAVVWVRKRGIT